MKCLLRLKVGVESGPYTSECTSLKGFEVRLTLTRMNFCFCLVWMHTVHTEPSFVYSGMRDRIVVGCMRAKRRCHSLDCEIVTAFRVDFDFVAAIGGLVEVDVGVFRGVFGD
jgi:hypothetical protein